MSTGSMPGQRYREAGVDLEAKGPLLSRVGELAASTFGPGVLEGIGGFSGLFSLRDAGLLSGEVRGSVTGDTALQDPVLVASADGVGTKLKLLAAHGRHETAGLDLVAMCVNDVLAAGAQPLFFLDYLAAGRLDAELVQRVVAGIAQGCREAGCALLGGETAEMPGMYGPDTYELAGFCVGIAERSRLLSRDRVRPGDRLIGIPSSGLHANGFSLVRRVLEAAGPVELGAPAPWSPGEGGGAVSLGDALLAPTRIYMQAVRALQSAVEVHALAHITGGGLPENLARVLPEGVGAVLRADTWRRPPVFDWLSDRGQLPEGEMWRVFNMGLGMVALVPPEAAGPAMAILRAAGEQPVEVGTVVPGAPPAAGEDAPDGRRWVFHGSAKRPGKGGWVAIATGH